MIVCYLQYVLPVVEDRQRGNRKEKSHLTESEKVLNPENRHVFPCKKPKVLIEIKNETPTKSLFKLELLLPITC